MAADDYYSWNERHNRPEERIKEALRKRDLERTQPVEVVEHSVSDTGVTRIREAISKNHRGER